MAPPQRSSQRPNMLRLQRLIRTDPWGVHWHGGRDCALLNGCRRHASCRHRSPLAPRCWQHCFPGLKNTLFERREGLNQSHFCGIFTSLVCRAQVVVDRLTGPGRRLRLGAWHGSYEPANASCYSAIRESFRRRCRWRRVNERCNRTDFEWAKRAAVINAVLLSSSELCRRSHCAQPLRQTAGDSRGQDSSFWVANSSCPALDDAGHRLHFDGARFCDRQLAADG